MPLFGSNETDSRRSIARVARVVEGYQFVADSALQLPDAIQDLVVALEQPKDLAVADCAVLLTGFRDTELLALQLQNLDIGLVLGRCRPCGDRLHARLQFAGQ